MSIKNKGKRNKFVEVNERNAESEKLKRFPS